MISRACSTVLTCALVMWLSIAPEAVASANMTPLDFRQAGQFTVQVPWRIGPDAHSVPLLVHGYFGYVWFMQEQVDLLVRGVDVEVNGAPVRGDGPHTFAFAGEEQVVRRAHSGRSFWYRLLELPVALFPVDRTSVVRVRIHRAGRGALVPPMFGRHPDMRVAPADSPYAGEAPAWFRFEVHRSAAPLPVLAGQAAGDTHVHTEYTHTQAEYGGPLEAYHRAAQAIGLDWATFTDHGACFDSAENLEKFNACSTYPPFAPRHGTALDSKWNEFVSRTRALAHSGSQRRFLGIVGIEADVRPPTTGPHDDYFCHLLVWGHGRVIPAEGANGIDWKVAGIPLRRGERGMSGTGDLYGADTPRLEPLLRDLSNGRYGRAYDAEPVVYLAHPMNKQAEFTPNPLHIGVWWRWGFDDEPDELPALYAAAPGRLRVAGFQLLNGNSAPYGEEVDDGVAYWDRILCDGLRARPPVRTAVAGGSDSHGSLTSSSHRGSVVSLAALKYFRAADGDGFGASRTLAWCGASPSEAQVLEALANGRTVASNGPALGVGLDRDADGQLAPGADALPSTRPGDEIVAPAASAGGSLVPITVQWRSTPEFGPVQEVRLILGRTSGSSVIWSARPDPAQALDGTTVIQLDAGTLPAWSYVRAECVTRKGEDVIRDGRLQRRRERRAYTSPVWISRSS